ncbi:MAG: hypothetical protein HKN94_08580 [Acidimicrobiales bacterium]|nr:hypothetical protein [Acidimicrobiales bacterium]RZV42459.1 MAG: hypothetical protein EX269_14820 [Acidimicrobiales bacterium]
MRGRLTIIGYALLVIGLVFGVAGGVAYSQVQDGYDSLHAFSETQNVTLNYNEDGQLIDRGSVETADEIMTMLTEEWQYPVVMSDLDPNDPLVNTGSEYMYQMAVITFHVIHGTQDVVVPEPGVEYNGEFFEAGTYTFEVDGKYWTDFDRMHPLEGPARGQAWTGTVHGLVGELGVGTVTHSTLQMGLALSGLFAGLGLTFIFMGAGAIWVARSKDETMVDDDMIDVPDFVPTDLVGSDS